MCPALLFYTQGYSMMNQISPVERVLEQLEDYNERGGEWRARCPSHNGNSDTSLSIKEGKNGQAVLYCHGGCSWEEIAGALNLSATDLFMDDDEPNGFTGFTSKKATKEPPKKKTYHWHDLPPGKYYFFHDLSRDTLYIQRHKGEYYKKNDLSLFETYKGVLNDVTRVPYRLPELIQGISEGKTIYVFEGCKDVDTAENRLDVVATTSGGATSWREEFKSYFTGANVVVVPDNDKEGHEYAETVARSVTPVAKSVKVVHLPNLPDKADLTDWLEAGHTAEEFFSVAEAAPEGIFENIENIENGKSEQKEEWELPVPFHEFNLPTFPTDALPEWAAQFVKAEAARTQTPEDLAGCLVLDVGALAVAKNIEIEPWPGWREPTNLYTAVVMPPGSRKSIVYKHTTRPVSDFEDKATQEETAAVAEQQTKYKIYEQRVNKMQQEASKARGEDFDSKMADAMTATRDLASIKVPALLKLLADDATPEALTTLLVNQGGRMALMSPEGDVFDMMSGRYSQGVPNLGVYLKGHAGDPIRVDRSGRPSEMIKAPALTIGIAVQPETLHGLTERPGFRGRGLLGRFLYSLPPNNLGNRDVGESKPMPSDIEAEYRSCVMEMLKLSLKTIEEELEPTVIKLSQDAKDKLKEFMTWLEPQLAPDGELGGMTDWAGKLAGAVVRLAGILYVMKRASGASVDNPLKIHSKWVIPADDVGRALKLADYFLAHARAAFAEMGADPVVEGAKHILAWIDRTGVTDFSKREAFQGTKGRFHKVSAMEPGLELLASHGHIREETSRGAKGRGRPSVRYTVNPLAGERINRISHSQYSQYSQKREE